MARKKHLVIAAAGTGGHVMPGIAVAKRMMRRGWRISWIGTPTGMERDLVTKHQIDFYRLNFQGMRGKGLVGAVRGGFKLLGAILKARQLLRELQADAVFSTGGYIAVPVGYGAKLTGLPLVMMNCDADILLSTKMVLRFCRYLACGFSGGARSFAGSKGVTTGNPVRREILRIPSPERRLAHRTGRPTLLVFGGSLGAKIFNDVVPEALALIPERRRPYVVHQTGKGRAEEVATHYEKLGVRAQVLPFIDDMARMYRESDFVLCRSGATSVSELCAAGSASILVPFVASTTSHQVGNAKYMVRQNAARMMMGTRFTPRRVAQRLQAITRDDILSMAQKARALAKADASEKVADLIRRTIK